jgi:raffinose/stachyose/melibiose transport system permease protein
MNRMLGNKKAIALFSTPALLLFTVIVFYPIIQTLQKSFYKWDGLSAPVFTGLRNYRDLFQDPLFYQSMGNGLIFALMLVIIQIGIATVLAFSLLHSKIRLRRFFRSAFFIPIVLSVTVVCQLWSAIYNPEFGLFNKLFEALGFSFRQDWLSDPEAALYAIIAVNIWQCVGYQFAIIYAGAKSIPAQYREAAMIDGANHFKVSTKIFLPMLFDTYRLCLIIAVTGGLNAYSHMNLLTKGGPGTATFSLTYMTLRSAFIIGKYGYGCSVAVVLVLQCIAATVIINKCMNREPVVY